MSNPAPAATTMDREFLGIRCRLIELAASLDRIDRAADLATDDPRPVQIRRSLEVLLTSGPDRAERVEMEFSLPLEERD
jgi:hypothetical protein